MPRNGRQRARQPGYDGKRHMVAALVDSPYSKGTYDAVVINLHEGPLSAMLARNQIDQAQYEAGSWFRATWEKTRMGSLAVDPSREPVDTSRRPEPIPDTVIIASQALGEVRPILGVDGYYIVEKVCGEGFTVKEQAHVGRTEKGTGWMLRHALDRLAVWLGLASPRND